MQEGRDSGAFASDLEARARELLVVQTLGEVPAELSLTPEADAALLAQAQRIDGAAVVRLLELLGEAMEAVRAGADPRTRLELALVKAARPALDGSTPALLARIERLERERGPAGAAPAAGGPTPNDARASTPLSAASQAGSPDKSRQPPPAAVPPPAPAPEGKDAGDGPVVADLESLRSLWPAVVDLVRAQNALLGALIEEAEPVALEGQELTVAFAASAPFLKKKAEDLKKLEDLNPFKKKKDEKK